MSLPSFLVFFITYEEIFLFVKKQPQLINASEGVQCLLLSFITIVDKTVVVSYYDVKAAHAIS